MYRSGAPRKQKIVLSGEDSTKVTVDHDASETQTMRVCLSGRASVTAMFGVLILIALVCWGDWIVMLLRLAITNEQYSHALLVLPVGLSLAIMEGKAKGLKPTWSPLAALP